MNVSKDDLQQLDRQSLHDLIHTVLLPRIEALTDWETCQHLMLRFKVLGGPGPAAAAEFQLAVIDETPATRDRHHLRLDISVDPLTGMTTGKSPLPAAQMALDDLLGDSTDPTVLCMPCDSADWPVDELAYDHERVQLVPTVAATVDEVADHHPDVWRIGLLGARAVIESQAYQRAFLNRGIVAAAPHPALQKIVDVLIEGGEINGTEHRGVKAGDASAAATRQLQQVVDHLRLQHRVDAFCVLSPDLHGLLGEQRNGEFRGDTHRLTVIRSLQELAKRFVREALLLQAAYLMDFESRLQMSGSRHNSLITQAA